MDGIEDLFDNSVISTRVREGYVMAYNFSQPILNQVPMGRIEDLFDNNSVIPMRVTEDDALSPSSLAQFVG